MRMRFSLRTLFIVTFAVALFCGWVVLPWVSAERFIHALASEDYPRADRYFWNSEDRFFEAWADKRWAFRATGETEPWSFRQMICGRREVAVRLSYFELDQTAVCTAKVAAKSFGIGTPVMSPVSYNGRYIDAPDDASTSRR